MSISPGEWLHSWCCAYGISEVQSLNSVHCTCTTLHDIYIYLDALCVANRNNVLHLFLQMNCICRTLYYRTACVIWFHICVTHTFMVSRAIIDFFYSFVAERFISIKNDCSFENPVLFIVFNFFFFTFFFNFSVDS